MKFKVLITVEAAKELDEAVEWIAQESADKAMEWFNSVVDATERLQTFPDRCALAPEGETFDQEVRQLLHGRYRILFIVREDTVYVIHVRHGARKHLSANEV